MSSLGVIEKDGSHQVFHRRNGEELDWGNVFGIILLCMCSPAASRTVGESDVFPQPILRGRKTEKGRHLQFYYYFNGFLYHSGIALSNALGP